MNRLLSIVPLLVMCSAAQDPAPEGAQGSLEAVSPAYVEPQSALRGVLLLRELFEEFASENADIAVLGAFATGQETASAGRAIVVHEMEAGFQAGEAGPAGAIRVKLDLEVRASGALAATRLYEGLRAFLSGNDAVMSQALRAVEETDDGRGIRIRGYPVVIDASRVEIERSRTLAGAGGAVKPLELIQMCASADRVELGPINITPSTLAFASGETLRSYRMTSRVRGKPFELVQITNFARVLENRSSDWFVTRLKLEQTTDKETRHAGWQLDVTASRVASTQLAPVIREPQSALRGMQLLHGYFQGYAKEVGGVTLGGAFALSAAGPPAKQVLVVNKIRGSYRVTKGEGEAAVHLDLDLEVLAGDAISAARLYEGLRAFLGETAEVESQSLSSFRELETGEGIALTGYKVVVDASKIGIARSDSNARGPLEHFMRCGTDERTRVGQVDIRPTKKALGSGRVMETFKIVSSRRGAILDLERIVAYADAIEVHSRDFYVTQLALAPNVDKKTQRRGWGFDLIVSRLQ